MIELMLAAMVLSGLIVSGARATSDVLTAARASKAGAWDFLDRDAERREARRRRRAKAWRKMRERRHRQAGGDGNYRPGARAYFGDVYHGWWEDQIARRTAKRAARPAPVYSYDPATGKLRRDGASAARPSLRQRWTAWADRQDARLLDGLRRVRDSRLARRVADHPLVRPVGEARPADVDPEVARVRDHLPADPDHPEWQSDEQIRDAISRQQAADAADRASTAGLSDAELAQREHDNAQRLRKAVGPALARTEDPDGCPTCSADWFPAGHICLTCGQKSAGGDAGETPHDDEQTRPERPTDGGTSMATTGEASNLEAALAELAAQEQQWASVIDAAGQARTLAGQLRAAADMLQQAARQATQAAQHTHDSLAARNLDGVTLGHAGTAATVIDAQQLDALYDEVEGLETSATAAMQDAEAGMAAVAAARATIVEKYGDAWGTVVGELGGNASFLDSGGSGVAASAAGGRFAQPPAGSYAQHGDGPATYNPILYDNIRGMPG